MQIKLGDVIKHVPTNRIWMVKAFGVKFQNDVTLETILDGRCVEKKFTRRQIRNDFFHLAVNKEG